MASKVDDPRLEQARERLEQAGTIKPGEADPETAKQAMDHVQEAKRLLALTRKEHLKDIRQLELDKIVDFFDKVVRQHARPTEASSFDNLVKTAQRAIDNPNSDFESHLDDLARPQLHDPVASGLVRHRSLSSGWLRMAYLLPRCPRACPACGCWRGSTEGQ
jgi:hypothetical protein